MIRRPPRSTLFPLHDALPISERLRQSDEVIESLLDREVSARLATLLLNLGDRFGEADGSGAALKVRLTHQDLANMIDRKSTRLNSSHANISYAVFCLKKKKHT